MFWSSQRQHNEQNKNFTKFSGYVLTLSATILVCYALLHTESKTALKHISYNFGSFFHLLGKFMITRSVGKRLLLPVRYLEICSLLRDAVQIFAAEA